MRNRREVIETTAAIIDIFKFKQINKSAVVTGAEVGGAKGVNQQILCDETQMWWGTANQLMRGER